MLALSSGDMIIPDANVKRIRVTRRKKLKHHTLGMLRHVTEFKLHASREDNYRSFSQGNSGIIKKTLQKYLNESHEKVDDAGVG